MGITNERPKSANYRLYKKQRAMVKQRKDKNISGAEWVRQAIEEKSVSEK